MSFYTNAVLSQRVIDQKRRKKIDVAKKIPDWNVNCFNEAPLHKSELQQQTSTVISPLYSLAHPLTPATHPSVSNTGKRVISRTPLFLNFVF